VKFLCDRCKTRYSIGDERVRGKILKIRCKNCANVITVREGMVADSEASPPAAPEYAGRAKKPTTMNPTVLSEASEPRGPGLPDPGRIPSGEPARSERARLSGAESPAAEPALRGGPGQPAAGPGGPSAREPAGVAPVRPGAPGEAQARRPAPSDPAGRVQPGAGRRAAGAPPRGEPNALNAAFASAMAKPPPALEEEWYVSIDGDQAGPFSLTEAQGWVAEKALDAELHCWSEGFDDWLPVDKVSHFRGLRKRPVAAAASPPLPRPGGLPQRAPAPAKPKAGDGPKPLFAATMASLERGAPPAASRGPASPRAMPPPGALLRGQPVTRSPNGAGGPGEPERRNDNGARNASITPVTPISPFQARQADARRAIGRPTGGPSDPPLPAAVGAPFDISEDSEPGDAKTQIEAMPFSDSIEPRRPTPLALSREPAASSSDAALTTPHMPAVSTLQGTSAGAAMTTTAVGFASASEHVPAVPAGTDGGGDDDDLAIGEVSRVVKLADIARTPRNPERSGPTRRAGTATGAVGRLTGQQPSLRATASIASVLPGPGADLAPAEPAEGDPSLTMAPVRTSHRRGLIALLSVAGVMVLGVVGAVIVLVTTNDDSTGSSLGQVRDIDTSRPEDPITHRPIDPTGSAGSAGSAAPGNPFVPRPRPRPNPIPVGSNRDPEPLPGNSLRGDEIEDVARKHQDMTQRCYMRSQRGADSILVGDVKKIAVTLVIDKDGNISDVQLSDHAADNLGKCLGGSIRTWKFRPSSGGTFRFSLNFVSG
jgi:predicted Zn finger-like uncharacterized protein